MTRRWRTPERHLRSPVLADWVCARAEGLNRVPVRDADGRGWREHHEARFRETGDERELVRAARHE